MACCYRKTIYKGRTGVRLLSVQPDLKMVLELMIRNDKRTFTFRGRPMTP